MYLFGEPGDFISLELWTSIFTLCNLLILFFVLRKLLFKPVKNMIDSRQKEIDNLYADAGKSKAEAETMRAEYEQRLAAAKRESDELVRDAHRRAERNAEEILNDARAQAQQTLRRADEQIEQEKRRAANELKNDVSVIAVDIASAVLARDVKADEQSELIDSFIDRLGQRHD